MNGVSAVGSSNNAFNVWIGNAAGAQVANFTCYAANPGASCTQHLWYLAAGTYSVVAVPVWGGKPSFNALLQPDIAGPAVATNGTTSIALGAGQVERLTFHANVGDTVALQVAGVTTTPAGQGVAFLVYRPDAGAITVNTPAYTSFGPLSAQTVNLSDLPVSGDYTVIVAPSYGLPASAQFSVVSDTAGPPPSYGTGTLPTDGSSQSHVASGAGQSVTLTFNANTGDNLELTLSNVAVAGSYYVRVNVYNATGGDMAGGVVCYATAGPSCRIALWNL
ncbi:hypothetical protein ACFPME_05420, partial [Rhodanobacter umsongensis]